MNTKQLTYPTIQEQQKYWIDKEAQSNNATHETREVPAGCHYNEPKAVAIEECGCCSQYHRVAYDGDCRNDKERFKA